MNLKFNEKEFIGVEDLLAGFIMQGEGNQTKFNLVASPTLQFNTAMQLIQSITINLLTAFIKQKPEAVEDIYDAYNFMASSVLNNLIPEKELRKDLDEHAILRAEENMLDNALAKMSVKDKEAALKKIEEIRVRLGKNGKHTKNNKKV